MDLHPIPAFSDNYVWMISSNGRAWVVDPGDAKPVRDALAKAEMTLEGILITHHHLDHIGGIADLSATTHCAVIGPVNPRIQGLTQTVTEGDVVSILDHDFEVLEVPGHTLDHIAFYCAEATLVFCGDTLFAGGCGRIFEGDAPMMHASLSRLASLPQVTRVCCAHEYTLANLAFARVAEPNNELLRQREIACRALRQKGLPTLPSTIGVELTTNPFLRAEAAFMKSSLASTDHFRGEDPVSLFAGLREWKDVF